MPEAVLDSRPKHPGRVAGGRMGALRRWGGQRIVRLDSLEPSVAAAVRALVAADQAARKEAAADDQGPAAASAEVTHAGVDSAA